MKHILAIDDDKSILQLLKDVLEDQNFCVDTAEDVIAATHLLKERSYDLILLDIMMSWMSGIDYCSTLKNTAATSDTPVIFLTARDSEVDMEKGYNVGAEDYIVKPFLVDDLIERIRSVIG